MLMFSVWIDLNDEEDFKDAHNFKGIGLDHKSLFISTLAVTLFYTTKGYLYGGYETH